MKNYESPVLSQMEDLVEGVYAASGSEGTFVPPATAWTVETSWDSHNSGSHSDGRVIAHYNLTTSANGILLYLSTNFDIETITCGDFSTTLTLLSARSFSIQRKQPVNPGETISFGFQLTSTVPEYGTEDGRKGAVGSSSDPNGTPYKVTLSSVTTL